MDWKSVPLSARSAGIKWSVSLRAKTASLSAARLGEDLPIVTDPTYDCILPRAQHSWRGSSSWITIVKTVLNDLWSHVGYEDDGHLVHTDKRTGKQFVSVKTWLNLVAARQAVTAGF